MSAVLCYGAFKEGMQKLTAQVVGGVPRLVRPIGLSSSHCEGGDAADRPLGPRPQGQGPGAADAMMTPGNHIIPTLLPGSVTRVASHHLDV